MGLSQIKQKHSQQQNNDNYNAKKSKNNQKAKPLRERKRRASMDNDLLNHHCKSFNISHFLMEIHHGLPSKPDHLQE